MVIEENKKLLGTEENGALVSSDSVKLFEDIMQGTQDFTKLMTYYKCAMMEIETKFNVLNEEFSLQFDRQPISTIKTRLKKPRSIFQKMAKNSCPLDLESMELYIRDIAGVRVVCSFIDDVYMLADLLLNQDDVTLIEKKDYIKNPKENGYRSLHLIVEIPIFLAHEKKTMKVEIQIRTIAMDFWASLEHQLKYKQEIPQQSEIIARLKSCADVINATDCEMLNIRKEIEHMTDVPSEEDVLFDRFSRMDVPLE